MSYKATILMLLWVILFFGLWFRNDILILYSNIGKALQELVPISSRIFEEIEKRADFENLIDKIKKEVFAPEPLNVGGKENQAFFAKDKIIAETNIHRYNNGLFPLIEDENLNAAAEAKAEDMFKKQYFAHISPTGVDTGVLIKSYGYDYIVSGENLILGNFASENEIIQRWMDSPGHRANILNERFAEIGVVIIKGIYNGKSVWIGVQEFGLPLSACGQADSELNNNIEFNRIELDRISLEIEIKRAEVENTNDKLSNYNNLVDEYNQLVNRYNSLAQETKNLIAQYNEQVNTFNECVSGKE